MIKKLVFLFFVFTNLAIANPNTWQKFTVLRAGEQKFLVKIADNPYLHAKGYMFRTYIPKNTGILFIFNEEKILSFWMKNTLQALSIYFYSSKGKEISRFSIAKPCKVLNCPIYSSPTAGRYVLEFNPSSWKYPYKNADLSFSLLY